MSVCRVNGALQHRWSPHRRRTNRVCIEPARSLDPEGPQRPRGLGTRLSRPGAWTDSLPPARSSPKRGTHRQLSAGWLRGAGLATGWLQGSTGAAFSFTGPRTDRPKALRLRSVWLGASPPVVASPAASPPALGSPGGSPIACGSSAVSTSAVQCSAHRADAAQHQWAPPRGFVARAELPKELRLQRRDRSHRLPGCRVASWAVGIHRDTGRWAGRCRTGSVTTRRTHRRSRRIGASTCALRPLRLAPAGHRFPQCQDAVLTSTTSAPGPEVARAG